MEAAQNCRRCHLPGQEYYARRKTCIKCILSQTKELYKKTYDPGVSEIKCSKCHILKSSEFYAISSKTGLYKEMCIQCRKPKNPIPEYFSKERYDQLHLWFKTLQITSNKDDMSMLKHIISIF